MQAKCTAMMLGVRRELSRYQCPVQLCMYPADVVDDIALVVDTCQVNQNVSI